MATQSAPPLSERNIAEFVQGRMDVRITCSCGREINIPSSNLGSMFGGWVTVSQAESRLKCKRCFKRGTARMVPARSM